MIICQQAIVTAGDSGFVASNMGGGGPRRGPPVHLGATDIAIATPPEAPSSFITLRANNKDHSRRAGGYNNIKYGHNDSEKEVQYGMSGLSLVITKNDEAKNSQDEGMNHDKLVNEQGAAQSILEEESAPSSPSSQDSIQESESSLMNDGNDSFLDVLPKSPFSSTINDEDNTSLSSYNRPDDQLDGLLFIDDGHGEDNTPISSLYQRCSRESRPCLKMFASSHHGSITSSVADSAHDLKDSNFDLWKDQLSDFKSFGASALLG